MKIRTSILLLTILFISSCGGGGGGTTTGNPASPIELRMEDRQPFAFLKKSLDSILRSAYASTSDVKFCFKRLRFKPDSSTSGSNYDLVLGQVTIAPSGTDLVTVTVPSGTYERIEFDLENECDGTPGRPSVSFINNNGNFSTSDHITIKFNGSFTVGASATLTLDIDKILDATDIISSNNQIKTSLEAVAGDF